MSRQRERSRHDRAYKDTRQESKLASPIKSLLNLRYKARPIASDFTAHAIGGAEAAARPGQSVSRGILSTLSLRVERWRRHVFRQGGVL